MVNESFIHALICNYLRTNYPDVIFTSDLSGVRLGMNLAKKVKPLKSGRGIPDLIIFQPAGAYHGLLIEIKTEQAKVLKRDGTLRKDDHLAEQMQTITRLRNLGYAAFFVRGFEAGRTLIESYMKLGPLEHLIDSQPIEWVKIKHTQ